MLDVASAKRPRCAVTQWFQDLAPPMLASAGPGIPATYSPPPEGGDTAGTATGEQPGRSAEDEGVRAGERGRREKAAAEAQEAAVAAAVEAPPPEALATRAAVEAEVLGVEAEAEVETGAEADCKKAAFEEGGLAEDEDQSRSRRPAVQLPPTAPTPKRVPARATRGARAAAPAAKLPPHTPGHGEMGPPGHGELGYGGSELQEPQETSFEIRLRGVT